MNTKFSKFDKFLAYNNITKPKGIYFRAIKDEKGDIFVPLCFETFVLYVLGFIPSSIKYLDKKRQLINGCLWKHRKLKFQYKRIWTI